MQHVVAAGAGIFGDDEIALGATHEQAQALPTRVTHRHSERVSTTVATVRGRRATLVQGAGRTRAQFPPVALLARAPVQRAVALTRTA